MSTETTETTTTVEPAPEQGSALPAGSATEVTETTTTTEPDTFPRDYVENLRRESAGYRERAKRADALAEALWLARVSATGRLADPTDLPFDPEALDDADALTERIDALLAVKPHLGDRRPSGDVGQGATLTAESVNLAGMLRART